jgi:hypothetical protein
LVARWQEAVHHFFTPALKRLKHNAMPRIQPVCFFAKGIALSSFSGYHFREQGMIVVKMPVCNSLTAESYGELKICHLMAIWSISR